MALRRRRAGQPRQNPVINGLGGDQFWIGAEHGAHVRNLRPTTPLSIRVDLDESGSALETRGGADPHVSEERHMRIDLHNLTPVQATLFPTMYGRALDSRAPHPILADTMAEELTGTIDYDFAKLRLGSSVVVQIALRGKMLDEMVRRFVAGHPDAVVLDLGAGLDTRMFRIAPPPTVDWYDVDFPEVIALRRRLLPEHAQAHAIGASLTAPGWLDQVPPDRPAMIVADGLLAFLTQDQSISLLTRLTSHFSSGDLAFNDYGREDRAAAVGLVALKVSAWAMKRYRPMKSLASLKANAGFDDPHQPERWNRRLKLVEEASLSRAPEVALFPPALRLITRLAARSTTLSRKARILRYRF